MAQMSQTRIQSSKMNSYGGNFQPSASNATVFPEGSFHYNEGDQESARSTDYLMHQNGNTSLVENCREFDALLGELDDAVEAGQAHKAQEKCQQIQSRREWKELADPMKDEMENGRYRYNLLKRNEVQKRYEKLMGSSSGGKCVWIIMAVCVIVVAVLVLLGLWWNNWFQPSTTPAPQYPPTVPITPPVPAPAPVPPPAPPPVATTTVGGSMSLKVDDPDAFVNDAGSKGAVQSALSNTLSGGRRLRFVDDVVEEAEWSTGRLLVSDDGQLTGRLLLSVEPKDVFISQVSKLPSGDVQVDYKVVVPEADKSGLDQALAGMDVTKLNVELQSQVIQKCQKGYVVTIDQFKTDSGVVLVPVTTTTTASTTTTIHTASTITSTTTTEALDFVKNEMAFVAPGTASDLADDSCTEKAIQDTIKKVMLSTSGNPEVVVEVTEVKAEPSTVAPGDVIKVLYKATVPSDFTTTSFIQQMCLVSNSDIQTELSTQIAASCSGSHTIHVAPGLAPLGPDTQKIRLSTTPDEEPSVFTRKEEGMVCIRYEGSSCSNGPAVALTKYGSSGYVAGTEYTKDCRLECEKDKGCGGFSYANTENVCFLHSSSGSRCELAKGLGGQGWVTYLCQLGLTDDQVDAVTG